MAGEKVKANRGSGGVDGPARKRASSDPSIAREFREKSSLNVARTNKPKTVPAAQAASFLPLFGNGYDVCALASLGIAGSRQTASAVASSVHLSFLRD